MQKNFTSSNHFKAHEQLLDRKHTNVSIVIKLHSFHSLWCYQRTHSGEKSYGLRNVRKYFAYSTLLDTHERTHNGENYMNVSSVGNPLLAFTYLKKQEQTYTVEKL
jgi:KRAB domain-containing zinc finger protein